MIKLGLDAFEPTVNLIKASTYGIDLSSKRLPISARRLFYDQFIVMNPISIGNAT